MKNKPYLVLIILFLMPIKATYGQEIPAQRATLAIIGEAENQKAQGMLSVACAIRNRKTLKGVYGEKNPRVLKRKYSAQTYKQAQEAWTKSAIPAQCEFIKGADHWENINAFGLPSWAKTMVKTYEYKDHVFYRSTKQPKKGKRNETLLSN